MRSIDPSVLGLACSGLVRRPGHLTFFALIELAHLRGDGRFGVSVIDLFAAARVERSAEVIIFADACGRTTAVPVSNLLRDADALLTLGSSRTPLLVSDDVPFRLDLDGWTSDTDIVAPTEMHAVTFSDFVRCR